MGRDISANFSPEYDLRYLQEALSTLEEYLLSREMYWHLSINPPHGSRPYPSLTIGNLLLAQLRLQARLLSSLNTSQVIRMSDQINHIRMHWRVTWEHKTAAEFHARLNLWRDFLEDYRQDPQGNHSRYTYEVNRRVILHLLAQETNQIPQVETELLWNLDQVLKAVFLPGEFLWQAEISSRFPPETFWFLYGELKKS